MSSELPPNRAGAVSVDVDVDVTGVHDEHMHDAGDFVDAADKAATSSVERAAAARAILAKALPPELVHPFEKVRALTQAFTEGVDVKIPATPAAVMKLLRCEGSDDDDTKAAIREWLTEGDNLEIDALGAVESAGRPVPNTLHETKQGDGKSRPTTGEAVVHGPLRALLFSVLEELKDPSFNFDVHHNVATITASKATDKTSGRVSAKKTSEASAKKTSEESAKADTSDSKREKRPYAQVVAPWLDPAVDVVCFVGEDKAADTPAKEVLEQLQTPNRYRFGRETHGTMESLLAVTGTGARVRFLELVPKEGSVGSLEARTLWGIGSDKPGDSSVEDNPLDLRKPGDRVRLVGLAVRLYRVLRGLVEFHAPTSHFNAESHAKAKGAPAIVFGDKDLDNKPIVIKSLARDRDAIVKGMGSIAALRTLYEDVRNASPGMPYIVHGLIPDVVGHVITYDIGFRRIPRTVAEAQLALRCVLEGLAWLHAKGVVHRDLRWPNVLKVAVDRFVIIDLELCAKLDDKRSAEWPTEDMLREEFWPPREDDEGWSPKHDLLQMVQLMWTAAEGGKKKTNSKTKKGGETKEVGVAADILDDATIKSVLGALRTSSATAGSGLALLRATSSN